MIDCNKETRGALAFVVPKKNVLFLDQDRRLKAKLILPQFVELLAAAGRQVSRTAQVGGLRGQNTASSNLSCESIVG